MIQHIKKEALATTMKNKLKVFSAIALVSLFGLTACNEVTAKPTDYDENIATITGYDEEIHNNLMSIIYDAIHDGSLGSDVLSRVLYQYSLSIFGAYNTQIQGRNTSEATLREAYDSANSSDQSLVTQFIVDHKAYWTVNSDGKHIDAEGNEKEITVDTVTTQEIARVTARYEDIEKRIAKKMYDTISGGAYSERSLFYEANFLMNLRSSMKDVKKPGDTGVVVTEGQLLDPEIEDVDVFNTIEVDGVDVTLLHRENYQSDYVGSTSLDDGITYIEDEIVPSIYEEMLVEQYILDSSYNTLGRSYARKVNVVGIKANADYPLESRYLIDEFVENYISGDAAAPKTGDSAATSVLASDNKVELETLKVLSNAIKGVGVVPGDDSEEDKLLAGAGFATKTIEGENLYLGTDYGDMMENYAKINYDEYLTDSSIESEFTNSGAYTKEVGKTIKSREIDLKDYTETGWYIKNGGLSNLPDTIRTRLFNVGVANKIIENEQDEARVAQDRWQLKEGDWSYGKIEKESNYVALINGRYFLKNDEASSDLNDMVFYDSSSTTYYIVEIEAAASSSKLSKVNENRYSVTLGDEELAESYINEICEKVASGDTYKTLSTKHWLEEAGINYHDDDVYDYFKSNYPELFED